MKNRVKKMNVAQLALHTLCIVLAAVFANILLNQPKDIIHNFFYTGTDFFQSIKSSTYSLNELFIFFLFVVFSWFSFIGAAFSIVAIASDKKGKEQGSGNFYGQLTSFPSTIISTTFLIFALCFGFMNGFTSDGVLMGALIILLINNFLAITLTFISIILYLVKGRKKNSQVQALQEVNA